MIFNLRIKAWIGCIKPDRDKSHREKPESKVRDCGEKSKMGRELFIGANVLRVCEVTKAFETANRY